MADRTVLNHEILTKGRRTHADGFISEYPSVRGKKSGDGGVKKADGVSVTGGSCRTDNFNGYFGDDKFIGNVEGDANINTIVSKSNGVDDRAVGQQRSPSTTSLTVVPTAATGAVAP